MKNMPKNSKTERKLLEIESMPLKRRPKRRNPKRIRSIRARTKLPLQDLRKKLVGPNPRMTIDMLPKRKAKRQRRRSPR